MKNKTAIHYDLNVKNGKEKLFIVVSKKNFLLEKVFTRKANALFAVMIKIFIASSTLGEGLGLGVMASELTFFMEKMMQCIY